MEIKQIDRNRFLVTDKHYRDRVTSDWFDAKVLAEQGAIIGSSQGRSTTWFFQKNNEQFVLRHYYRGGFLSKWVQDSYLFTGIRRTRGYQEFSLLQQMYQKNLPVPEPVAFLVKKKGMLYHAWIIIRLIKDTEDLFHILQERSLSADEWRGVGALIRHFHDEGIYHSDLNIHNILLDQQGHFWLIDFDKGRLFSKQSSKLQANLARLQRSLRKETTKNTGFNWREEEWSFLLEGYSADKAH